MTEEIFLLTDYRGLFYSSTKQRGASVDVERLTNYFAANNFKLIIQPLANVDFRAQNYKEKWVLYQSSEDPGLFYRSYIEDIIYGLSIQGAKLIPNFSQFKAHHNKHFLEILRDLDSSLIIKNLHSKRYGTFEDYLKDFGNIKNSLFVLKSYDTSKSKGVFLLDNTNKKLRLPRFISKTFSLKNFHYFFETIKTGKKTRKISNHRKKFILQSYVEGLQGDYRVVIYGDKYYVLFRKNRVNDFRASGSMNFEYDIRLPDGLLDYAKEVFDGFDAPYVALDIGVRDNTFYLFEFQFLSFGQYTLENSKFYYHFHNNEWQRKFENPDLEREIAVSICQFIKRHK